MSLRMYKLKNYQKTQKELMSKSATIVIIAILIAVIFCAYFYNLFIKFQINYSQMWNNYTIEQLNSLNDDLPKISLQLLNNNNHIINVMLRKDTQLQSFRSASNQISDIKFYNAMIDSVYIYSEKNRNVLVSDIYHTIPLNEFIQMRPNFGILLEKYKNGANFIPNTEIINNENREGSKRDYVSYVYHDYRGLYVVLNIPQSYFKDAILKDTYPIDYSTVFFNNKHDLIFTDSNTPVMADRYFNAKNHIGSFFYRNILHIYLTTERFSVVSIVNLSDIIKNTLQTSSSIIILLLLLLGLLFVITYFFFFKRKELLDLHLKYKSELDKSNTQLFVDLSIHKLFVGEFISTKDKKLISDYFQVNPVECFKAMIVNIDDFNDLQNENSYLDIAALKYGICNVLNEILLNIGHCKTVSLDHSVITVILSGSLKNLDTNVIRDYIEVISQIVNENLQISLSFTVSSSLQTVEEIIARSPNLLKLNEYKFIHGNGCILFEDDNKNLPVVETYPSDLQEKILDSLTRSDIISYSEYISEFGKYLSHSNYLLTKIWIFNLFFAISESARKISTISIKYNILENLISCDTLEKTILLLQNSVEFENKVKPQTILSANEHFINLVQKITSEQYANPDYNTYFLSNQLNLTTAHVGQKFKKLFNMSFNQYLTEYRMDHAMKLLNESDDTNAKIAEKCGFSSETYFITTFKKYVSQTPGEYRLKKQKHLFN